LEAKSNTIYQSSPNVIAQSRTIHNLVGGTLFDFRTLDTTQHSNTRYLTTTTWASNHRRCRGEAWLPASQL